ncbi:AMP-dependent synthetase [Sphingomonas sp. Leaf23]|uniref:AMP-binding protein n=1 Tax=Sphingomonas sp. Leaf23 TaxID=1735689 RepID=UPI0006F6819E|nr:AMP-binding protein [Sphingomonas sp. Leaf23]KQM86093.1 AMP-dependent synthetase [Sphingomonas sp. Leaf23]
MTPLLRAIDAHAAAMPDAIAIDGDTRYSWADLAQLIPVLAATLASRFPGGRPVATRVDHGADACLLDLALIEAGCVSLPLPPFFTTAQEDHALESAGAQALLSGPVTLRGSELLVATRALTGPAVALPEGTARITFTSGSTGAPKGVCLSREHLCGVAGAVVEHLGTHHAGRHLPVLPPGILLENVAGFYATILAGGTYVAQPQAAIGMGDPFRPDGAALVRAIVGRGITSLILVPELLGLLVKTLFATGERLPALTLVAVGGARVPDALLAAATAIGLPVRQGYGLTECGSVVSLDDGTAPGSVGRSIGSNTIRLADDGEVLIDGPLFLGTVGAPRTAGPLATGDIGRIDDAGRLWIEGRKSALIVTSHGRNIAPEWVEGVLLMQPAIRQVLVRGEGRAELDALIVPASPDADVAAAVAAANGTLPAYARIGAFRVVPPFTPASGLLTGNGRLRRAAIHAAYPDKEPLMTQPFFHRLVAETREAQARFAMTPQLQAGLTGRISRADYIAYLTQAYHHVSHTVLLMQEARARLIDRPMLVEALDEYIEEETGHEHWILDDIAAAGGDRAAAAASEPAPATRAMVEHAYRTIREGNPAAFFGMVLVLEGTSIALATHGASAVQSTLGLPDNAFRYLTSHGALDQDHMVFFEKLMNRIDDPADQAAIIAMARDMFGLFGGVFAGIELEDTRAAA